MVFGVHIILFLFHFEFQDQQDEMESKLLEKKKKAFWEESSFRSKISDVILTFVYQGMKMIFDSVCSLLIFESYMPITGGVIAVDVQKNRACSAGLHYFKLF